MVILLLSIEIPLQKQSSIKIKCTMIKINWVLAQLILLKDYNILQRKLQTITDLV